MTTTAGDRSDELAQAGLDGQNRTPLGRLLGTGSSGYAEKGADGKLRGTVQIPVDELCWEPAILILPHGGELELTLINHDKNTHCAVLPSNGDDQFIWLVRSEEHTSELQSRGHLVCRLLLEKQIERYTQII